MDITAGNHGGNEYSREAHNSILGSKEAVRTMVLTHIRQQGTTGATADEVEKVLGMLPQSVSARFTELKALGQIKPTGDKRKTRSGRNAGVWWVPQNLEQAKLFEGDENNGRD